MNEQPNTVAEVKVPATIVEAEDGTVKFVQDEKTVGTEGAPKANVTQAQPQN